VVGDSNVRRVCWASGETSPSLLSDYLDLVRSDQSSTIGTYFIFILDSTLGLMGFYLSSTPILRRARARKEGKRATHYLGIIMIFQVEFALLRSFVDDSDDLRWNLGRTALP
jgi:hypothetical protein